MIINLMSEGHRKVSEGIRDGQSGRESERESKIERERKQLMKDVTGYENE